MSVMCLATLLQLQGLYTPGPGAYEVKPVEKHAPQVLHPFAHCKIHSRNSDMRKIWWRVAASRSTEFRSGDFAHSLASGNTRKQSSVV